MWVIINKNIESDLPYGHTLSTNYRPRQRLRKDH